MTISLEGDLVDFEFFSLLAERPIFGGDPQKGGYLTEGDIKYRTADGVNYNDLWLEFQDTLTLYNEHLGNLISLFTYPVQSLVELVPRVGEIGFEKASEFGVPKSARVDVDYYQLAYDFDDYDLALRYTWKYLRDADARQVQAIHGRAMEADRALIFRKTMEAIFDNRTRLADINGQPYNVYPLYNGDGVAPPPYKGVSFTGSHSHYVVTESAKLDPEDVEDAIGLLTEHGYGFDTGTQIVALSHKAQINEVRKWQRGGKYGDADDVEANYDWIPARTQPAIVLPNGEGILGSLPPDFWNGMRVQGSYADVLWIEEPTFPAGYVLYLATGGVAALENLVGIREHPDPAWKGLRLLPGNQNSYPLVDGFYQRSFGTGIRQRGGAVVQQVKASGTYDIPAKFLRGGGLK